MSSNEANEQEEGYRDGKNYRLWSEHEPKRRISLDNGVPCHSPVSSIPCATGDNGTEEETLG